MSAASGDGQRCCYAASATALLATGLGSPLPLPLGQKSSPPSGWTGADAPYASAADVARWAAERPGANIALRLAPDVVGIDVDAHKGPQALATVARFEAEYGPLPPTWTSSARTAPSGIRWYRLPEGATSAGMGDLGPGVELIRAGHRYACVPPSLHPLGVPVAWRNPDGAPSDTPPMHRELPVLSDRQVEGLEAHRRTTPSPAPASRRTPGSSAVPEVPEALRARVKAYARQAYAGLVADAQALAALPEGDRMLLYGELAGWEAGLAKSIVLRACQFDAATWHGGAPGTFVAAVRGVSVDPAWTSLVDEKAAAKARIAEPASLPRFVAEHDASDVFGYGGGDATAPAAAPEAKEKGPNPAVLVAKYALGRYEAHLSPDGEPFAVPHSGPRLAIPLGEKGGSLRARVADELYRATGNVFSAEAISGGVGILRARALGLTTLTPMHLRVASTTSRMVIDLCQPNSSRCVVIDGAGWSIYDEPPPGLLFRRPPSLKPLPDPIRGGSLEPLRALLGFTRQDRRWQLVRGWLVASMLGDIPRPLLLLLGPAGSGKTSRGLLIINVLDPRGELGSSFGRNADDDQVKALSRYLVGYDNLTSLSETVMGHLCRLVTGESAEKRRNYSDTETVVVSYKRTGVLTAITLPQVRADVLDRLIPLHLDPMPPGARSSETRLHATFAAAHPSILGAVCDGAAVMLSRFPQLVDEDVSGPRNMDFGLALAAYDPACAVAYQEAADDVLVTAAEDDPFVVTVRDWLLSWAKSTGRRERVNLPAEAFAAVTHYARGRDDFASTWWPTKAKTFTQSMTRAAGPLAAVGVTFRAGQTKGRRVWRFELSEEAAR